MSGLTEHTKEEIERWARMLTLLAEEHGRPNTFYLREIRPHGGRAWVGYAFKSDLHLNYLWEKLGGRSGWGSRPVYRNGKIYV